MGLYFFLGCLWVQGFLWVFLLAVPCWCLFTGLWDSKQSLDSSSAPGSHLDSIIQ